MREMAQKTQVRQMGNFDKAARQIDKHLQQVATQLAQELGLHQSVNRHKKGNP